MLPGFMKDLAKVLAMLLLLLPVNSFSLGLGEINLHSALNQSLDAEVGLLSVGNTDVDEIKVRLATRDEFEKAGLERPLFLTKFKFEVLKRADGNPYLKITSREPVKEPFLDFIIEANWPGGRILREYTLLLDPPVLVDERPSALDIPLSDNEGASTSNASAELPQRVSSEADNSTVTPARVALRIAPRVSEVSTTSRGEITYGPVKRTDTLWKIASQMKPDNSVTVQQVMMALLNENPEAFDNNNINDLKAGYFLRISDPAVISDISSGEAERIANLQYEQWVDAKHATALAAGERPLGATSDGASSVSQSDVESRLKLVAPDEGMSQSGSGSSLGAEDGDIRQELAFALESVDVSRQENEELRERLAALEEQLASMQRLLTLKGDTLAAMQVNPEELATTEPPVNDAEVMSDDAVFVEDQDAPLPAEVGGDPMLAANEMQSSETTATESPQVTPPPVAVPPPPVETSMIDDVLAVFDGLLGDTSSMLPDMGGILGGIDPILALGGLAVAALVAGGLVMRRRKMAAYEEALDDDSEVSSFAETSPAPEVTEAASDEAVESVLSDAIPEYSSTGGGMDVSDEDEIDAIAEADVYLAYRRYDKAEELLSEAVQNEPDRHDLQVKLLEVYAASDKKDEFIAQAEKLHTSLGDSESSTWKSVAEMGKKIAPTSALFSGGVEAVVDSTGVSDELEMDLPDLGGDLGLDNLEVGGGQPAETVLPESDNPFEDVNEDELDGLGDNDLGDAFNALDDLGELEASLDSAMEMASEGDSEVLPDLDLSMAEDVPESTEGSDEISLENELELDSVSDAELGDTLDTSSELSFEESADESSVGSDSLSGEEDVLDFSENETSLALDDVTETAAPESGADATVPDNELKFDESQTEPVSAEDGEDLSNDLSASDDTLALDDVEKKEFSAEAEPVKASAKEADDDVEEDLFAGLDNSTGDSADDDWLSDFNADISSLDEEFGDLEDSDLFSAEDEVGTKLDLARAYIDMGDNESAKGILDEVVNDGNDDQKKDANELIERIA